MNPLATDLYQLEMIDAYLAEGLTRPASFEFFVRALPPRRDFLIAAGLEQAIEFLLGLRFSDEELARLAALGRFSARLLDWLQQVRFTGDVDALDEGTLAFPNEPLFRVTAPLPEAQLVETQLVNAVHFQTVIASKAARLVRAARGRPLYEFGLRRAHGLEAGLYAARAAWLTGFDGTSNVEAGLRFGIPLRGTLAHSYVQAHDDERAALAAFARAHPEGAVLLIDTYDVEAGARAAAAIARAGARVRGVRIDSGDLGAHARRVRAIFDEAGLRELKIFVSGGLDERALDALADAPIAGYGVGTSLTTSADAPTLDCAYKLVDYDGRPRRKRSEGKATWPGRKQIFRARDHRGRPIGDTITVAGDALPGEPLLRPMVRAGRRVAPAPSLDRIRARVAVELARAPAAPYPVALAPALRALARSLDEK